MNTEWVDPELARQLFENAMLAAASSFVVAAAVLGLLYLVFIVGECGKLLQKPYAHNPRAPL